MPVPRFWPPGTACLIQVSNVTPNRLRGKQEVLWASPDFAWMLFGKAQTKADDPRHAFRTLVARLMPEYFAVLSARYGVEGLIVEARRVLDYAFLAANYRYTQVVGSDMYRMGLSVWPPQDFLQRCRNANKTATASSQASPAALTGPSGADAPADASQAEPAVPAASGQAALTDGGESGWQECGDGARVRTEPYMRLFMLSRGLHVRPSSTHGANNCLIDSLLLALQHAGVVRAEVDVGDRALICARLRRHLVMEHGENPDGYLAHDRVLPQIFQHLRDTEKAVFVDAAHAQSIALTVTVVDRFTCRDDLVPTDPVLVPSVAGLEPSHMQVQLYACTDRHGIGYHYEWVEPVDGSAD